MVNMTKAQLLSYYRELGEKPPAWVKRARPATVFGFGLTLRFDSRGRSIMESAPLHKVRRQ